MTVTEQSPLSDTDLRNLDAYWRAANYLSVGQIYLMDNPLLREPLRPEHIKPLAAVRDGRSVDTTMGFTPLEGLVMATRSGTVDPGWCSGWPTTWARRPPS